MQEIASTDIVAVAERLRESKEAQAEENYDSGYSVGSRWARTAASIAELEYVALEVFNERHRHVFFTLNLRHSLAELEPDDNGEYEAGISVYGDQVSISVGSYLIVQDTHLGDTVPFWFLEKEEERWIPGPRAAVEEFVAGSDQFIIDRSRERLLATNNRRGFLKKVR